jgi:pre-peptidase
VEDDIVAPQTGTYLVQVATFDSGFDGEGTYRLTLTKTPGPITVSPGDQGGPMTNGAIHEGEILQGDVDVWTFTATAGERLSVHIGEITDTDDFRPWIRVWTPAGGTVGDTSGVSATVEDDIVAPQTGTYLVQVATFDSGFDGEGTYRLTLTKTPGPITVSPGDQGGALTNGGTHPGDILTGDVDVWTITAAAGEHITVTITETADLNDFRPWIRLWAPNGATLGDVAGVSTAQINAAVAPAAGTYLVLVASYDSGFDGTGSYDLVVNVTPP